MKLLTVQPVLSALPARKQENFKTKLNLFVMARSHHTFCFYVSVTICAKFYNIIGRIGTPFTVFVTLMEKMTHVHGVNS